MRPHRLRFAGIGPYPDLVEIDFDDLSALGLYLIVGPTGAGKTTIFDAITFALYGKVAGERPENGLVSDHTHRQAPFVELDFSHRGHHFRAFRRPAIDGKPPKPTEIRLTEYADADCQREVHAVTGTTAVTKDITEMIGLDHSQFMRVMLLPQNEFQQFLLANSGDKQPLLRALFGTRLFEQIAFQIADSAKALAKSAAAKQEELERSRYVIREVVDTLEADGLVGGLPDPDTALAALIMQLVTAVDAAKGEQQAAGDRSTQAIEEFAKAEHDAQRFDAAVMIGELERESRRLAPQVTDAGERLRLDERALRAAQALQARDDARTEADEAKAQTALARASVCEAVRVRVDAPVLSTLRNTAPSAPPSKLTSALTAAKAKVDGARSDFTQADSRDADAARQTTLEQQHRTTAEQATEKARSVSIDLQATRDRVSIARTLAKTFAELDGQLRDLSALLAAADVPGTTATLVAAQAAATKAKTAYDKVNDALAVAREARTRHLAGELGEKLVDGEPCPVCGSLEHPNRARTTADGLDVTSLETKRDKAHTTLTAAEHALSDAQRAVEKAQAAAAELPTPVEQTTLRTSHAAAAHARDELDDLEQSVENVSAELVVQEKRRDAAVKDAEASAQQALTFQSQAQRHRTAARVVVEEAVLVDVQRVLDRAEVCISLLDAASRHQDAAANTREHADGQAIAALQREGFDKESDVAKATLDEPTRVELQILLDDDTQRTDNLTHLRGFVGKEAAPAKRPDVDALAQAKAAAQTAYEASSERAAELGNGLASIQKQHKQITKLGPDVDRLVERANRAQHIAAVVTKGSHPLLPLERWVQRAAFEEVCDVASEQMRALSHGRYVLTLEASGKRSRARADGLDLYVTDSHTGRTRPVQSLSGGEQFLTSLALALALAEVVQNRSGGIELSTLFIDEGFGSLDGDTLDTAVEVLRSLQDSGRTVGLISHVDAMRQELTVGIQVVPGPTGSSLKVMSVAA